MKKRVRRGFTLVEVSLFLAITGFLFIGIVAGVQGSMFQQRYNDSVQSFAEFLRSIYSQVANVESSRVGNGGQTDQAIYGKLVVFGENFDLSGGATDDAVVYVYTVVGGAIGDTNKDDALGSLADLKANVVTKKGGVDFLGIADQYFPKWGAGIQTTDGWSNKSKSYKPFKGALLIVRHPNSGTTFTYVYEEKGDSLNENLKINEWIGASNMAANMPDPLGGLLNKFEVKDVDFCINPEGDKKSQRRDVRIIRGAKNSSGVEVIAQDGEENKCGK